MADIDLDAGVGWYEWIAMPTATTQVAYVHEGGTVYLPDGEFTAEDFLLAAAEGRAHRLVRATEVAEAEARGAREALDRVRADLRADAFVRSYESGAYTASEVFDIAARYTPDWLTQARAEQEDV